jgi:CelD/BcsL family acetyltransferase involved in cellulose biosynthesis
MIKGTIDNMAVGDTSDVSCEVIDSYNNINHALEKEWDDLVVVTRGSIYLTCAWSRTWWEFYGKAKTLRIFIFRCNSKLVGVMPVYIERFRIGLMKIRIARLVGAYNPPRVFDAPIVKEYATAVCEHLVKQLTGCDRCDLISIGPLSDECEAKEALFTAFERMTDELGIVRNVPFYVYTYFDLPETFDAYMKTLSKSERSNRRYYEKLLAKEHAIDTVVIRDPDHIAAEMAQLSALHAAQWRPQKRLGYFESWPASGAFNHRLAFELSQLGRTRIVKIMAGTTPIIYEYYYIFGNCGYWQVSARALGKEWDRYSLGATGAFIMIRNIMDEGITHIEGGVSHYDYKTRLGAKDSHTSILRIVAHRPCSVVKYNLFNALHILYEKLYYKLWYQRIQLRLPAFFHRPIWITYTRTIF